MNRPPQYPDYKVPSTPHWRRWWLALLLLWGLQSAALLTLWPKEQPRLELGLWSAVLPLCWALALALRVLPWQIGLLNRDAYHRTREAATLRWWRRRSLGLPVQQVLLLGPAGDAQEDYQALLASALVPEPVLPTGAAQRMLRCPLSLSVSGERAPALARHLARLTLALPTLAERWPQLRAIAWVGDANSQAAFLQVLSQADVLLPEIRLPVQGLADLDDLIEAFHRDCCEEADWLLCAGVVSVEHAEEAELAGEAGFFWLVSRKGKQLLHRGEYLLTEAEESATVLCAQLQRYAGLEAAPATCLALDETSAKAFVEGGWSVGEHQLARYWGALGQLAPFVGMSLALLHAQEAGQSCGWLCRDGDKRLTIGVAVPHGNS